ncbi:HAD family hydrolase, partial [Jatrophihabitans sp.]|uniref:HAD family hydrolase n=1 Tax=Jatrophihabitans sp. TaxID=1932789 RepID=UPI0030C728A0|nr:HAD-superfamily hydrolase, subfamily [Jatrophihabitans sp.]
MTRPAIRLVASDLDGTLLRSDGTVSDRSRAALRAAEEAGLVIAFVTGRPPRWLDAVIDETGHLGVAVGANGAVLYDLATEEIISAHYLDVATLQVLTGELRQRFPKARFAVEYGDGFGAEPGYTHDWQINPTLDRRGNPVPAATIGSLAEIITRPAMKLLVKDRGSDADHLLAGAVELLGPRASITHSSSFGLLEIAVPGITKATGLAELAARHQISAEEIVAIGDMPNDVPMLEWVGRSYAVSNAHPAAKAAAAEVVGSNDEDAVALVIEAALGL